MFRWGKTIALSLLSGGVLAGLSLQAPAATSSTLDILSDDRAADTPNSVDVGRVTPIARPNREAAKPLPGGNPLWSISLSLLPATQERPIFSVSRRPPQRAVVSSPVEQAAAPVPKKAAEPERPPLALIGAVVGDGDAIAVFLDRTNQKIVRLRQGDMHAGWVLRSVQPREVTLRKADQTEVLVLQRPDGPAGVPALAVPASGGVDASYAPFVPRKTPRNGESDGL